MNQRKSTDKNHSECDFHFELFTTAGLLVTNKATNELLSTPTIAGLHNKSRSSGELPPPIIHSTRKSLFISINQYIHNGFRSTSEFAISVCGSKGR